MTVKRRTSISRPSTSLAQMSNASMKPKVSDLSRPNLVLADDAKNTMLNCRVSRTLRSITLYACSSWTPQASSSSPGFPLSHAPPSQSEYLYQRERYENREERYEPSIPRPKHEGHQCQQCCCQPDRWNYTTHWSASVQLTQAYIGPYLRTRSSVPRRSTMEARRRNRGRVCIRS